MERKLLLTTRGRFSASHYYYISEWPLEKNRLIFGKSANRNGHGHNYNVDLTICGEVEPKTGMVMNIQELKSVFQEVLNELDHKNLNIEIPSFQSSLPTPENLVLYLWDKLYKKVEPTQLHSIRIHEDESVMVEYQGVFSLTKSYDFSAAHRLYSPHFSEALNQKIYGKCTNAKGHGHNYTLEITISGLPKRETDLLRAREELDHIVKEKILKSWDHRNFDEEIEPFQSQPSTGENIAVLAWNKLENEFNGNIHLVSVKIGETPNAFFEYRGQPNAGVEAK